MLRMYHACKEALKIIGDISTATISGNAGVPQVRTDYSALSTPSYSQPQTSPANNEAGASQQQFGVPPSSSCSHWASGALRSFLQTSSSGGRETRGRSALCPRQASSWQPSSSTHSFETSSTPTAGPTS